MFRREVLPSSSDGAHFSFFSVLHSFHFSSSRNFAISFVTFLIISSLPYFSSVIFSFQLHKPSLDVAYCLLQSAFIETFFAHNYYFHLSLHIPRGTSWRSWLRHCAISRKVAGSILVGDIRIFHWHNPSGRTMSLQVTQPLIEMSTRNIALGVKAAGV